jgi:glutathione S-transferase
MNLHESNTILDIPISAKHPQMHGPRSVFPGLVILGASDSFLNERPAKRMSNEFDSLDAREKAAAEAALNRCRALAARIESELRNMRPEHFVDDLSLADLHVSLERAAGVLEQKSRDNTPAPAKKGS